VVALTIGGSDSSGGAGIAADLKTMAAFGVHGAAAITAVTAQTSLVVDSVFQVPLELLQRQIEMVLDDMRPRGIKTGLIPSVAMIEAIAEMLARGPLLVVDPVMVAGTGDRLTTEDTLGALRATLIPIAAVITPNIAEAEVLTNRTIASLADRRQAARDLVAMGAGAAIVKGGHAQGEAVDVFCDSDGPVDIPGSGRIDAPEVHGTGCAYSAAITAQLALGLSPLESARGAKAFLERAILRSSRAGPGPAPINPCSKPQSVGVRNQPVGNPTEPHSPTDS
jgi:hydroxymethylpyrimidine/phosphomethylpyrimidine kinase